jgi:hypothetical protein
MSALISAILGLVNHQTEAEKQQLIQSEGEQQRQTDLYNQSVAQPAGITAKNKAVSAIGTQNAPSWGMNPAVADTMINEDGTYRPPSDLSQAYQTQANLNTGVYPTIASATTAGAGADIAKAAQEKQLAMSQVSPAIAGNLATLAANQAKTAATQSGYPNESQNQEVAHQLYGQGLLADLSSKNRGIVDSSMDFSPGSKYGMRVDPYSGVADITPNPFAPYSTQVMPSLNNPQTHLPVRDSSGKVVGYTPHFLNPDASVPDTSITNVANNAITPPIGYSGHGAGGIWNTDQTPSPAAIPVSHTTGRRSSAPYSGNQPTSANDVGALQALRSYLYQKGWY